MTFLDTNVLVYAIDLADPVKRDVSLDLIQKHLKSGTGVISTQVLQEFYSAATKKLKIAPIDARTYDRDFRAFRIVQLSPTLIEQGIDRSISSQVSFWDALILVAAANAGCDELLTEDLSDGQIVDGVRIANPFRTLSS